MLKKKANCSTLAIHLKRDAGRISTNFEHPFTTHACPLNIQERTNVFQALVSRLSGIQEESLIKEWTLVHHHGIHVPKFDAKEELTIVELTKV